MHHKRKSRAYAVVLGVASATIGLIPSPPALADDQTMTACVVSQKMTSGELTAYLAGIVEGLAHARYIKDDKATEGRSCIYSWFYDDKSTQRKINEAFERYPDTLPGRIIGALVATKCGT